MNVTAWDVVCSVILGGNRRCGMCIESGLSTAHKGSKSALHKNRGEVLDDI